MINLKNNYKLISIHEHEIEISYLEKKLSKHRENDCMNYQFLKKKEELKVSNEINLLIKCRQSNCDIEFNQYAIVFNGEEYYKINENDIWDGIVYIGTNEEKKVFIVQKINENIFNHIKIKFWINCFDMINKKEKKEENIKGQYKFNVDIEDNANYNNNIEQNALKIICEEFINQNKKIGKLKKENVELIKEKDKTKDQKDKMETENINLKKNKDNLINEIDEKKKENQNLKDKINKLNNQYEGILKNNNNIGNLMIENENLKKQLKENNKKYKNSFDELNELKKSVRLGTDKFNEKETYDIIIDINSLLNLNKIGWEIKYPKGKEEYERKMKMDTIVIGVIGNRNKGKSFILQKLSGYKVPQGYSIITEGLSIKYGEEEDHCIAILDSAGKETPLLNPKENETDENNRDKIQNANENININNDKNYENEKLKGKNSYEICLRDKLITETYIQKFIIDTSHILILVVGNINLNEQKLLENIKSLLKKEQYLYVIHNLIESYTKEQVNNYIEEQLKNLFGIKLKEINFQNNKGDYHQKYYVEEENEKVTHLIYVNEYSSIADYYNTPTIKFLKTKNNAEQRRIKFSVVEACKEYLEKIGDTFIEEKIAKSNFENGNNEKIILVNFKNITLKRVFIDAIGKTVTNTFNQPNYSYYTTDKDLIINIEVPGEEAETKGKVEKAQDFYIFSFMGNKPCDEAVLAENHKVSYSLKKKQDFKFSIYISVKDITLGLNDNGKLNFYQKLKKDGIFTFKYHINDGESTEFE